MPDGKEWVLILYVRNLVGMRSLVEMRKKINPESRGKDDSERDRDRQLEIS